MEETPLFSGDGIFKLIPQRAPIVMIDTLWRADDSSAETGLSIADDNIFCRDGIFTEPGIIEHAAQSAAAFIGLDTYMKGLPPSVGYIAEIKKFNFMHVPKAGDTLRTSLKVIGSVLGMTMMDAQVNDGDSVVARGRLKFFLKGD